MATFTPPTLASETIAHMGSFPIRNSMVMAWLAMLVLIIIAVVFKKKGMKMVPRGFQNLIETVIEGFFNFFNSITQDKKLTRRIFPVIMTIFLFVILSNWMGILPGVGPIGFYDKHHGEEVAVPHAEAGEEAPAPATHIETIEKSVVLDQQTPGSKIINAGDPDVQEAVHEQGLVFVPYFRSAYADVNMTFALALISVIATQLFGIMGLGFFHYAGKFFVNPVKDFIGSFIGLLELISEFAKMISFAFRLFGNIFAGEILLLVISFLAPFGAPIPFYGLEIFVGFVQALVFSLLTTVFIKMAVTRHGDDHEETPMTSAVSSS